MFADRVEFLDIRAGGTQKFGERNFVRQRNPFDGRGQERRASPRQQAKTEVVWTQYRNRIQNPLRPIDAVRGRLIHAGWSSGPKGNPRQLPLTIVRDVDPSGKLLLRHQGLAQRLFQPRRHAGSCLSRADHGDSPDRRQVDWLIPDQKLAAGNLHEFPHQPVAADGIHAGLPDCQGIFA